MSTPKISISKSGAGAILAPGNATTFASNVQSALKSLTDKVFVAPTIAQVVSGIFKQFDANADTAISKTEVLAIIDPKGTSTGASSLVTTLFSKVDSNADSKLSTPEVTTAVSAIDTNKSGTLDPGDKAAAAAYTAAEEALDVLLDHHPGAGHAPPAPRTVVQIVDGIFTQFDASKNGVITSAEFLAVLDPKGSHTWIAKAVSDFIAKSDSDKVAGLSRAEITAAVAALDTNKDGVLDRSDLGLHAPHGMAVVDLIGVILHGAEHSGLGG